MVSQCCSVLPLRPDLWMALVKNVVGALKEDLELSCARIKKLQSSDAGKRRKNPSERVRSGFPCLPRLMSNEGSDTGRGPSNLSSKKSTPHPSKITGFRQWVVGKRNSHRGKPEKSSRVTFIRPIFTANHSIMLLSCWGKCKNSRTQINQICS